MKHTIHLYEDGYTTHYDPNIMHDEWFLDKIEISEAQFNMLELYTHYQTYYVLHQKMEYSYEADQLAEVALVINQTKDRLGSK